MFVDASAAVAVILNETDIDEYRRKLKSAKQKFMSCVADYEAAIAVRRNWRLSSAESFGIVGQFKHIYAVGQIDLARVHGEIALEAFERFGKGQGHKAGLNMGDCFAYACAKANKIPLLFKGDDFNHTDITLA